MSKEEKNILVVGDKLKNLSVHSNVYTISSLKRLIKYNEDYINPEKYIVHFGQGLSELQVKEILKIVECHGMSDRIIFKDSRLNTKSNSRLTHKCLSKNIMISEPIKINDEIYHCDLMLEDDCDEMNDHVTGVHIQGSVLIEAARQMVLAVSEKYFISADFKRKLNFVTHKIDTTFHQYIFPIPVVMKYKVSEMKMSRNNNFSSSVHISFVQNDYVASEIFFKFSVLDAEYLSEQEISLAALCIKSHFDKALGV